MANSRILELSAGIAKDTAIVDDLCKRHNIPSPSYDVSALPTIRVPPSEVAANQAQDNIISAARELMNLMLGPQRIATNIGYVDAFALHAISRFHVAQHVPVNGKVLYEEIARSCGANARDLKRVLRYAMTNGYFCEREAGFVSHTSLSRVLAESKVTRGSHAFIFEESFPAAARTTDALEKHPGSEEPTLSGWGLANNARQPMFAELHEEYPERDRNAALAMDSWSATLPSGPLVDNFPWSSVDSVVDVGGGHGHVCLAIAQKHARPKFVVQDMANVVAAGAAYIPEELRERFTFQQHDMFQEQPVKHADVYFYRGVFHDWPDKYCVQMLKALIPALKPGARVVINDACLPTPGTLAATPERLKRMWDLIMMISFNARDREAAEWAQLFHEADGRFRFIGVRLPSVNVDGMSPAALMSIIEAVWEA